ncbi:MAG: hypothetical protein ABJF10_29230 [Chthoniobacter sp.]|uniref:hypothetical protein n=1 Tax=Chthoniobacter sp. TaxID=2510640 RepID=UPI0032A81B42
MKTIHTPAAIALGAMIGAFAFPPNAMAEATPQHAETAPAANLPKTGMKFSSGDGKPGHFRLECHGVPAYDALVAIAKRRGYELSFDPAGETVCRSSTLNGVYAQPWLGLDMADIEPIIIESISAGAGLPSGQILRFIRTDKKKGPAMIAVVPRAALNAHGQLMMTASKKGQPGIAISKKR